MKKWKEQKNFIVAASLLAVIYGVFAFFFDFYYDLNDDVLIKDMLEGCVSGTPSGYNNQMLYPISFCISLPYHLTASIPWFAIFLCGCQFTAVCLILARIFTIVEKKTEKKQLKLQLVAGGITTGLLFMVMMLWETVYVQYTVSCGLLVAAACFLTATNAVLEKDSVKDEIPSIILLFLAMNIRSEMFLLCCPLIAVTGMILWIDEYFNMSSEEFAEKMIPYTETNMLIYEAINLEASYTNEKVKLSEKRSMTKDMAVVMSYANYIITKIENQWAQSAQEEDVDYEDVQLVF